MLHLLKLCVGCDSIGDLEAWIGQRRRMPAGRPDEHVHTTRMTPKRAEELLVDGSLYWVIAGQLSCRQRLIDLRSVVDGEGIGRCQLVLEPRVVPVVPRPVRPFQGWRYLVGREAPADLDEDTAQIAAMPEPMRRELVALGLL